MDYHEMTQTVLEVFAGRRPHVDLPLTSVWEALVEQKLGTRREVIISRGGNSTTSQTRDLSAEGALFDEVINDLLRAGVLALAFAEKRHSQATDAVRVTRYGQTVLEGDRPNPYDPDGYLQSIDAFGMLDGVLMEYTVEAVHSFRHGCFRSSVVMVGGASERMARLLEEALSECSDQAVSEAVATHAPKFGSDENLPAATRIALIQVVLDALKKNGRMKSRLDLKEAADDLATLLQAIRRARNEHGHPVSVGDSRGTALTALQLLPSTLKHGHLLLRWLRGEDGD